jgi:pimeloyl-ACP methyl ester carboxylesterase/DNA-binding CsgD family transcriptional regulator
MAAWADYHRVCDQPAKHNVPADLILSTSADMGFYTSYPYNAMSPTIKKTDNTRASRTAELVDTLYSLTVDSADYDEFMKSWSAVSDAWTVELSASPEARSEREQQALLQHFQRAEQIFARIGRHQKVTGDLQSVVEGKSHPALVVDAVGQVMVSNSALQQLILEDVIGASLARLLKILIGTGAEPDSTGSDQLIGAASSKLVLIEGEPCLLVSTPLSDGEHTLVDFSRARWHDDLETDLRAMFGLSLSEVAICHLLYEGYEVKEIAELRSRAEDTVRKQIKSIHSKTCCTRQVDFMRLLTGMLVMGQMGQHDMGVDSRLVNRESLRLPDGRELYYFHLTPPGSVQQTVVITHGIASSPLFPRAVFDILLANGISILGISRAGYGRSSPVPSGANPLDQFTNDLKQLLDHLQLQQVSLVSMQSGAMFSFAALSQLKQRITRMVCIAPIIPLATSEEIAALPTGLKILARTKKLFPAFFPLVIQTVLTRIDAGEVDSLYRSWYKGVPCDLAVVEDPDNRQLLDSWLRFCGAQGGEPYITDTGFVLSDWSAMIDTRTAPVLILHGDGDETVPREVLLKFVAQHPYIEVDTVPAAGQLMIFAEPEAIAHRVLSFLS